MRRLQSFTLFLAAFASLLLLVSCHRSADKETSDIAAIIPSDLDGEPTPAIEARYTQWPDPDTVLIYIDGLRYKVASDGNIFAPDGKLKYKIRNEGSIASLYFFQKGSSLFLFYTDVTPNGVGNYAKRLNVQTGEVIWSCDISGVAMSRPIIKGQFAYIAASGFIGKLKLKNGQFDWRYSNLNDGGRFEKFLDITFPSNTEVLFVAPHTLSLESDSILVKDINGEVVRMN